MLNKNVADYTNFDGRTNKKIVQAPGGLSSFSLAWSDQKTDYGTDRKIKKEAPNQGYPQGIQQGYQQNYQQKPQQPGYSEPMRVMEPTYASNRNQGYGGQMGGQMGYNGYNNQRQNTDGGYGQSNDNKGSKHVGYKNQPLDQLDHLQMALEKQQLSQQRPPSVPQRQNSQNDGRSCIKINAPPRQNLIFGGNEYNYWKDDQGSHKKLDSEKSVPYHQQQQSYGSRVPENREKTSVRVHNPPGGKQNFTLG